MDQLYIPDTIMDRGRCLESAYMPNGANALRSATPRPVNPKEPYFDTSAPQNVSALIGKSAYLTCKVRNIGNRTQSGAAFVGPLCRWTVSGKASSWFSVQRAQHNGV
ncbi:hypothetical protein AAG570_013009 [Ranatra chinensis]|uniref:Ig-like domain-containing protein n=1 Tax=Ranatra chinensis TaxID=642074 RepID=A0ABD0YFI5_9HEMI